MKYHELQLNAKRSAKRVGRGIAAGRGKTAGRGTKGQNARSGGSRRPGFEGGQTPLMQRLPKLPGFKSHRPKVELIYTGQLDQFANKTADNAAIAAAGLTSSPYVRVKLVQKGEVTKKVVVKLQAASQGAIEALEKVGGSFTAVDRQARPVTKKADK